MAIVGVIFINNSTSPWEISQGNEIFFNVIFYKLSLRIYLPKSMTGFWPSQGNGLSELPVFILELHL